MKYARIRQDIMETESEKNDRQEKSAVDLFGSGLSPVSAVSL